MSSRTSTFQVKFTTDGSGAVKADIESVAKAAVDGSNEVNDKAGKNWEAFGYKIGTAIRYAGFAAVAGMALVIKNTIQAQQELAQLDAVLLSTGNSAGYNRDQLVSMAEGIAKSSAYSSGEIVKAETRLLSYSGIASEVFPAALQVAIDQAQRLGMSVEASAETIGRALESPTKAAAALAQQGFGAAFTDAIRKSIKALEDAGDTAAAQRIVIDILNESYQGAAKAARDTLGGALIGLKNDFNDLLTGDTGGEGIKGTTAAVNDLASTLSSPETKQAFNDMMGGLAGVASQAIATITALREYYGEASKRGSVVLQNQVDDQEGRVFAQARIAKRTVNIPFLGAGDAKLLTQEQAELTRLKAAQAAAVEREEDGRRRALGVRIIDGSVPAKSGGAVAADPKKSRVKEAKAELTEFQKLMEDLSVYEGIWGDAAVDASNAKIDAWERENEEQERRSEVAQDMQNDIELEIQAMGLSNEQLEIRNNLLAAGVSAESERGAAIVESTKRLQEARESMNALNDIKDATTDLAASALYDFSSAGDAAEEYYDRLKRLAAQMLAEKAMQMLFQMFMGGGGANGDQGGIVDLFGSSDWGYATGGYTGPGGRNQIAGAVHKGEVVFSQDDVARAGGVNNVEALRMRGYANGGIVGGNGVGDFIQGGGAGGMPRIEFNVQNNTGGKAEMEEPTLTMENGKLIIQTAVNLAVGKINDGLARKGSPTNKSMLAGLGRGTVYG